MLSWYCWCLHYQLLPGFPWRDLFLGFWKNSVPRFAGSSDRSQSALPYRLRCVTQICLRCRLTLRRGLLSASAPPRQILSWGSSLVDHPSTVVMVYRWTRFSRAYSGRICSVITFGLHRLIAPGLPFGKALGLRFEQFLGPDFEQVLGCILDLSSSIKAYWHLVASKSHFLRSLTHWFGPIGISRLSLTEPAHRCICRPLTWSISSWFRKEGFLCSNCLVVC